MKYAFVQTREQHFPVAMPCRMLEVSRSGSRLARPPGTPREEDNRPIDEVIRRLFGRHRGRYSVPRLTVE